jgi:hypothetical protein
LKKCCSQFGARIFELWQGFGEGAGLENPVTEPKRSQSSKRPLSLTGLPNGYNIFENALEQNCSLIVSSARVNMGNTHTGKSRKAPTKPETNQIKPRVTPNQTGIGASRAFSDLRPWGGRAQSNRALHSHHLFPHHHKKRLPAAPAFHLRSPAPLVSFTARYEL